MQIAAGAGLIATSSRTAVPCPLHRPTGCEQVLALLASYETPPVLIAGGTDLCAQFNEGLQPGAMIALDRVVDLQQVTADADILRIGSGVTHAAGSVNGLVRAKLPGFAEAWAKISNVRVRFWGTIGGNLMARRTRYEMSVLLTAADARLVFLGADGGFVDCTTADVWAGATPPWALLHHVAIPLRGRVRFQYDRSLRPIMTLAVCTDEAGSRGAIATERLRPVALAVPSGSSAAEASAAAFAHLPANFEDAATHNWYLKRVGAVMLRRALEKVQADA